MMRIKSVTVRMRALKRIFALNLVAVYLHFIPGAWARPTFLPRGPLPGSTRMVTPINVTVSLLGTTAAESLEKYPTDLVGDIVLQQGSESVLGRSREGTQLDPQGVFQPAFIAHAHQPVTLGVHADILPDNIGASQAGYTATQTLRDFLTQQPVAHLTQGGSSTHPGAMGRFLNWLFERASTGIGGLTVPTPHTPDARTQAAPVRTAQQPLGPRASGILLHPTSLPSLGIGDIGPEAHRFVDFLAASGQTYWQMLPLTPTDGGMDESPFAGPSAIARNTLLISPYFLVQDGWLSQEDLDPAIDDTPGTIDFEYVRAYKERLSNAVWARYQARPAYREEFDIFKRKNAYWLDDYALFMAIKESFSLQAWDTWPDKYRLRGPDALQEFSRRHADRIEHLNLLQFIFVQQWDRLKAHAHSRGIRLIGNVPIYVGYDSADVWAHPEYFELNENRAMKYVSGVPPDYFSKRGQLWGTPVYKWRALQDTGYQWWIERLRYTFELVDKVLIDHFRGLVQFWRVPAGAKTAMPEEGALWVDGPGETFFTALKRNFPGALIGEDLGVITPDVVAMMQNFDIPGLKVLQFAFGDENITDNPYVPENHTPQSVVYTGTHDNDTTLGWLRNTPNLLELLNLWRYLEGSGMPIPETWEGLAWEIVRLAMGSVANTAILPMQDVLRLGSKGRMNRPATHGNWRWRMELGAINNGIEESLLALTRDAGRMRP